MQFKDVIGQAEVKEQLVQLVQHNRLSHALLFLGKEGSGGLPLALAFAQYIVCEKTIGNQKQAQPSMFGELPATDEPTTNNDSCGVCPACTKANQLVHPDIHFSYPIISKLINYMI